MPVSQRKLLGAWYTPPQLVDAVVAEVRRGFTPRTVLDPACGDGRFLAPFADTATRHRNRHRPLDILDPWRLAVDRLGRAAIRCRRRQSPIPQPTGSLDLARRTIKVRRRALRRQRSRVPFAGGTADPTRWARRAGAAAVDAVDARRHRDSRRGLPACRVAMDVVVDDADVRGQRPRVGGSVGGRRCQGDGAPRIRSRIRARPAIAMPAQWSGLIADTVEAPHEARCSATSPTFTADFRDQYSASSARSATAARARH